MVPPPSTLPSSESAENLSSALARFARVRSSMVDRRRSAHGRLERKLSRFGRVDSDVASRFTAGTAREGGGGLSSDSWCVRLLRSRVHNAKNATTAMLTIPRATTKMGSLSQAKATNFFVTWSTPNFFAMVSTAVFPIVW